MLPQPIYRYEDRKRKTRAAAIFAFAHRQNPELLLTFEYSPEKHEGLSCELVRVAGARLHVFWNDKRIWVSESGTGPCLFGSYRSFFYGDLDGMPNVTDEIIQKAKKRQ